ncbi:retrovirus-related pol polyprotein from transposon TNT 1-94 [Tanacetum coccineum]
MLAPKGSTYNGRLTFVNPMYLKKAQSEKLCLYEIPYDTSDLASKFAPDREETLTLEQKSRSKLNKDLVKSYDYIKQISLYKNFKPASQEYHDQLAHANEVRKKMWRKSFVKTKPKFFKNISFLLTSKSISKSRQAYNVMTNNINHFRELVDQAWEKHSHDQFRAPTAHDMEVLIKTCLMPLAIETQNDSFKFLSELKQEMFEDLNYVQSLEKEVDELGYDKADFSNIYDLLLQECVSKDIMCSILHSFVDLDEQTELQCLYLDMTKDMTKRYLDEQTELQCLYLDKIKECESLANEISKQKDKQCQEQMKIDTICKQNGSTVFLKEHEQYHEIQDLKAQLQDKNIAIRVIHNTSVSRPQLKSTQIKDKVVQNNSQVKFKKTKVEDHHRISSISNKTKSVTTCNDSLKSKTLNVNAVCATYGKCVFNSTHDACVSKFLNDVNARTKKPKVVPISIRKPKSQANKFVATPHKKTIASDPTIRNSKSYFRMLYASTRNVTIKRVYYVEGLNHNLFSVSQFCDADLEVAFRKSTCFVGDLQGNDLLTVNCRSNLYTISLQETSSPTPICFMAKASPTQAWLWHRRLSHLNFDYNNLLLKKDIVIGLPKLKYVKDQLCSSCKLSKAKRSSFKTKVVPSLKGRLNLLHMDLCGPMYVASINGNKYILVIVDDYSRCTLTLFLRSKDKTPEVLKDFLKMIQRNLQAQVITIRTDKGTKFLNKTLHAYVKEEGIEHQTSTPRTPEQNDVVKRQNQTLVEVARTMLSASKLPLFFWAEAITTACYTQNKSIIIPNHEKTAYHIINDRKPSITSSHLWLHLLLNQRW